MNNRDIFRKPLENVNMSRKFAAGAASYNALAREPRDNWDVQDIHPFDRYCVPYSLVNIILESSLRYFFSTMYLLISFIAKAMELEERKIS